MVLATCDYSNEDQVTDLKADEELIAEAQTYYFHQKNTLLELACQLDQAAK